MKTLVYFLNMCCLSFACAFGQSVEEKVASALEGHLKGYRFNKHLATIHEQDRFLLFDKGEDTCLIGWSNQEGGSNTYLPNEGVGFVAYDLRGQEVGELKSDKNWVIFPLENSPLIFKPKKTSELLQLASAMEKMPEVLELEGPTVLTLRCSLKNILDRTLIISKADETVGIAPGKDYVLEKKLNIRRDSTDKRVAIGIMGIYQIVTIVVTNPLALSIQPRKANKLTFLLENPTREPLFADFRFEMFDENGKSLGQEVFPLSVKAGLKEWTLHMPLPDVLERVPYVQIALLEQIRGKGYISSLTPILSFQSLASLKVLDPSEGLLNYKLLVHNAQGKAEKAKGPNGGEATIIHCRFEKAEGEVKLVPLGNLGRLKGKASQIGMWLKSDGAGSLVSIVLQDSMGRVFETEKRPVYRTQWHYAHFKLHHPWIKNNGALLPSVLIRSPQGKVPHQSSLAIAGLTVGYDHFWKTPQSQPDSVKVDYYKGRMGTVDKNADKSFIIPQDAIPPSLRKK